MGDAVGKGSPDRNSSADALARISQELFAQTGPIREGLVDRSTNFLQGGADVRNTPQFANLQAQTGDAFNQASDNIIGTFGRGGPIRSQLTQLEGDRASTLSQGAAGLQENELARALSIGSGFTQGAMGCMRSSSCTSPRKKKFTFRSSINA